MYLNCHSFYSLRYGTLSPEKLAKCAKDKGIECLVLTDINNSSAHFDFYRACKKEGIRPLLGMEFRAEDGKPLWIGIAQNEEGLYELNHFFTQCSLDGRPLPATAPDFQYAYVIYRLAWGVPETLRAFEYLGIAPHEVAKLFSASWKYPKDKMVAVCPVTCEDKEGYVKHELLRAIDQNVLLSRLDNTYSAHPAEFFHSPAETELAYAAFPELLANAKQLLECCHMELDLETVKNPAFCNASEKEDFKELTRLALAGFKTRYKTREKREEALVRLRKELLLIRQCKFLSYFLITYDILQEARRLGYHHVGRGSGANSIVAYCLRITDVDPMTLDLYFERFINESRKSPPDFDIDFCWNERDAIYEYMLRTYNGQGKYHAALLATFSTFQENSLVREIGKVYGIPKGDIDFYLEEPKETQRHHPLMTEVKKWAKELDEYPNHLGIHAGGVIITDRPINYYTALQMMPKGFPIVQFDMHVAEENKFHKYDLLSQRGLGHIKDTVQLVKQNKGVEIDIHDVDRFYEDKNIKEKLGKADTVGCFYIESPAMRGLITKLGCTEYLELVAASSIIRPGVAHSGMMREYIHRFHNRDNVKYPDPIFERLLKETFGIMVYQEDVIKIAHHFGGLSLSEADILRRTMSGKNRNKEELEQSRQKFFEHCRAQGRPDELTAEIWRQIDSFSGYSFCKAHSASYAVESYQSLFLKTYYPLEFMVGVINNFGGFYRTEIYVHEARMCGANIEAPCVNHSEYLTSIEGSTIYLGFVHLKALEEGLAKRIVKERKTNGAYRNMEDFVRRTEIGKEQLGILIRIGALRFTGRSKQELLWNKHQYLRRPKPTLATTALFDSCEDRDLPQLEVDEQEDAYEQMELLGFPLVSPFSLLKAKSRKDVVLTKDLKDKIGQEVKMLGYFVTRKDVRTVNGKIMNFGTWVDEEGKFFDSTHFPFSLETYPFRGNGCYLLKGKVVEDFGFPSLEVDRMARLEWSHGEQ